MKAKAIFALLSLLGASTAVKVGILHSQTGTLSISELSVIDAEKLAIEEINRAGGVLGEQITYEVLDGESTASVFATKIQTLIADPNVVNIFGCWTSASRKAVKPYIEASSKLLFYPVQYEGQECSSNIFYSGAAPNQQIEPAVRWLLSNYPGKKMYLVGSNYVFPQTANRIIKSMLETLAVPNTYAGETYVPLPADAAESTSNGIVLNAMLAKIKQDFPQGVTIFNTLNGDANVQLFQAMATLNMPASLYPTMSVSITEQEVGTIGPQYLIGHFASWNYMMTDPDVPPVTDSDYLSQTFISSFRNRFGNTSILNDPMEAGYINVYAWAKAVEQAQSFAYDKVRAAVYGVSIDAPEGTVTYLQNHHLSKFVRIGRFNNKGLFDIVFKPSTPVVPEPWNLFIPETSGYRCDHSIGKSFYMPPTVNVGILYDPSFSHILDAQLLALEEINNFRGGILGQTIKPIFVNLARDDAYLADILEKFTSVHNVRTIFSTSMSIESWKRIERLAPNLLNKVSTDLKSDAPLWYVIPNYPGTQSYRNVFYMGHTVPQTYNASLTWLLTQSPDAFYIIGQSDSAYSNEVSAFVTTFLAGKKPIVGKQMFPADGSLDVVKIDSIVAEISASSSKRVFIINTLASSNKNIDALFKALSPSSATYRVTAPHKVVILSPLIDERQLTVEMRDHFSAGGYFEELRNPENAVFLQSIAGRYGDDIVVTEQVEKAYTAIFIYYSTITSQYRSLTSAEITTDVLAEAFDPVRIRVNMYSFGQFRTPSGIMVAERNNRFTMVNRIAIVNKIGNKLQYRMRVAGDDINVKLESAVPAEFNQDSADFFGAFRVPAEQWDALHIVVIIFTIISFIFSVAVAGWVVVHRNKLIIKLTDPKFMYVVTAGSVVNCIYVVINTVTAKTNGHCQFEPWPAHFGFFLVFGALVMRCYILFSTKSTRRNMKAQKRSDFSRTLSIFLGVFLLYMIIWTAVDPHDVRTVDVTLTDGVLIKETTTCAVTIWQYVVIAVETLMVAAGCFMAVQIRNVPTIFNESFYMGVSIYLWTVIKIINEIFLGFIPFNADVDYGMRAFGVLIPTVYTVGLFVYPKFVIIGRGQGDDPTVLTPKTKDNEEFAGATTMEVEATSEIA